MEAEVRRWLTESNREQTIAYSPGQWGDAPWYDTVMDYRGSQEAEFHRRKRPQLWGRSI